ncbi:uncharacterized protein [Miscanthus floridulus]|uniref:uncharacterized protein n=1 Tax=Miscanthus floridulus TaxID=154761 RepID=UPI00345B453F
MSPLAAVAPPAACGTLGGVAPGWRLLDSDDSDDESLSNDDSEVEDLDDIIKDKEPEQMPDADYDKKDPPMAVGAVYSDIPSFKLALATHSMKHEYHYNIEASDTGRYRATCTAQNDGCPWRIHASTLKDGVTIKIKRNPFSHQCQSARRDCRPYLAVDSTFLTGRFRGQLCISCAVDGDNWMYLVAVGVIDSETNENWVWFMGRLKEAIGSPPGLTFSTDCGQAEMNRVSEVFPEAEHRKCMYHLVQNFKKRYSGKVFYEHLWASAYSWSPYMFDKHYQAMAAAKAEAMKYLQDTHKKLWTRSQFGTASKVDYVTNNLAESFNNWIKVEKQKHLDDLMDTIK